MAKTKTVVTTKKTRKKYFRRYKSISNYFKCILNVPMVARYHYDQNQPVLGFKGDGLDMARSYALAVLMQISPMWNSYNNLFSMFKLRGVKVKAQAVGENSRFAGEAMFKLGYVKQGAGYDWRLVSESNYQLTLPYIGNSSFWIPMISSGVGWIKTSNVITDQPGQFMIAVFPDNPVGDITLNWNLEFIFYITYKLSIY